MLEKSFFSIRYKLMIMIILVSVVVVSSASLLFYNYETKTLKKATIESAQIQASIIGASISSAIIFDDDNSAKATLALFSNNNQVEFAAVYLPDNSVFAQYAPQGTSGSLPPVVEEMKSTFIEHDDLSLTQPVTWGENFVETTQLITDQDLIIGRLYIRSSLSKLNAQHAYYLKILSYVFLFSIILAIVLASRAHRIITQPLHVMVSYVDQLRRSKDYHQRLNLPLNDELGTLAHGFNHLLDEVQNRELELKNQSKNLQQLVDKRTEQLYQKAHFDSLTLLPNRYLLSDRLEHAIASAKRKQESLAVLFMDLDRFKIINDSLGHDVGDELLKAAAIRLQSLGRDLDTVARLGGDEFIYLAEGITKVEDAGRIAQKINEAFKTPFELEKHTLHVSTSIGIAVYPTDGEESHLLLKNADVSMYHAKEKGPGQYCFYRHDMNDAIHERLEVENQLRNAIIKDELHLVYQPQVNLETGEIQKVEALLRWKNSELGVVSPADFIPIAEEIGLIYELGKWVIETACAEQEKWAGRALPIAINVSSSQLLDATLIDDIKASTTKHNVGLESLELEITEEVFLDRSERTIGILSALQSLGIKISIDDFGTGYSSLSYLKDLPVDTLKLDGMFVMDLLENSSSRGIVSSTIILAHSLNMQIVAECVETAEQLAFLKSQHCDLVQGFHLYKPLTADQLSQILD